MILYHGGTEAVISVYEFYDEAWLDFAGRN